MGASTRATNQRRGIALARDTLDEVNDSAARAFIRAEIEELEGHWLSAMAAGVVLPESIKNSHAQPQND